MSRLPRQIARIAGLSCIASALAGCSVLTGGLRTYLYRNDGSGNFTWDAVASGPIQNSKYGKLEFADLDGDGDQDLLLVGGDNGAGLFAIVGIAGVASRPVDEAPVSAAYLNGTTSVPTPGGPN